MCGNIGISAVQRRLLRTMQPLASTATLALEKAPLEYPYLRLVQFPSAILAVRGAVPQQTKKIGLYATAEPASLSILSKMARLLLHKVDQTVVDSAIHKTRARRQSRALRTERPLLHLRTGRRALLDLVLSPVTTHSALPPDQVKVVFQQPLTDPKETHRGWQLCISPILAFHQTNR